jgi:hypothetical protein
MGLNIFLRSNTNSAAAMAIKVYKGSSPKKYNIYIYYQSNSKIKSSYQKLFILKLYTNEKNI